MNNTKPGRRVPKTAGQRYPGTKKTKTENTKDFRDWVDAGMPDTWKPRSGPNVGSSTREDVGMIAESLMKKRKR